jgi:hypothetical protein
VPPIAPRRGVAPRPPTAAPARRGALARVLTLRPVTPPEPGAPPVYRVIDPSDDSGRRDDATYSPDSGRSGHPARSTRRRDAGVPARRSAGLDAYRRAVAGGDVGLGRRLDRLA